VTALGLPRQAAIAAVAAGVLLGVIYTLSPLAVWFALAMWALAAWAVHDLDGTERRWVLALLVFAIVCRVIAIGGLFALTDHARVPFGSFFGDEEYFIRRSLWLRNVALGIPIHRADLIYAFDEYSYTLYLYVLAFLQVLVGPAPYGLHLFATALYFAGAVMLYRGARQAFGVVPAFAGLLLLLFLPSQFAWSISALKEPLFFCMSALSIVLAARIPSERSWLRRALLAIFIAAIALSLQTIREGGLAMTVLGVTGGIAGGVLLQRPRAGFVAMLAAPLLVALVWSQPIVQVTAWNAVKQVARVHWGHVYTSGFVYKLLDPRLNEERSAIESLQRDEGLRYIIRAFVHYVSEPVPWNLRSRAALAFMPEQMIWYTLVLCLPIGVVVALKRAPLFASLLASYGLTAIVFVALTSGNIGTLVRHRGLALPFIIWLSAVGGAEIVVRLARHSSRFASDGRRAERGVIPPEFTCQS
jgi:hypothetical protein